MGKIGDDDPFRPWHIDNLLCFKRLDWSSGKVGAVLSRTSCVVKGENKSVPINSHFLSVHKRIAQQLPEKNKEHLRYQLNHSVFGFIAGSAILDSKILENIKNARIDDEQEMLFAFIDYASGGISNTQASEGKINILFWQEYFSKHSVLFE